MEFKDDDVKSDNPFVDKLLKNLKILAYNCIIKDEYTANRAETTESINNAEVYMACMENRVSLVMFEQIPDQFLREVGLDDYTIRIYKNLHYNVDVIPKDNPSIGLNYREQLVSKLRPWFLNNYEEKNEYYRMLIGQPPLNEWGIPLRDYESYLPNGFTYTGEFIHEVGTDVCRELESYGVLDIIKADYPNAKYLNYVTSGLSAYDVRKSLDFMILWTPDDCDYNITEEFKHRYQDRRDFLLRAVYSSAMELESEHYHATMQIYLLVMTIVDMLVEIPSHIIKKDLLDRRCIEYIFSSYGIPYYKDIPYKYQERICFNIHNLLKYKSSTENLGIIKKIFDVDDVEFFKYYILKVRKKTNNGELLMYGDTVRKSNLNDIMISEDYTIDSSDTVTIPFPIDNYLSNNAFHFSSNNVLLNDIDYTIEDNSIILNNNTIFPLTITFIYTKANILPISSEIVVTNITYKDKINVNEPFEDAVVNNWPYYILTSSNTILKDSQFEVIDNGLYILDKNLNEDSYNFLFYYINDSKYVYEEWVEDYNNTTNLVFSKIPILDLYSSKYLLDEGRWKDYDMVISRDEWWLGQQYKSNNYNIVKNAIYESPYNYMRSKYYGIGRVIEMSSNSARLAFFYSSLYDDLFYEPNLNISVPTLSNSHTFNLAHLFIYLTVLTQIHKGYKDMEIEDESDNPDYYVSGFNYKANIDDIVEYLINHNYDVSKFKDIFEFEFPNTSISNMKSFMEIQNHNEEVYHIIRNHVVNAQDYGEYQMWLYIYETLFTWKFNQEYFKLNNNTIASSYLTFLKEKDSVLYNSVINISTIKDVEQRLNTITTIIDDICYLLEDYLDTGFTNYIFSEFVGHNTNDILTYIIRLVELFKSHRIVLNERGEVLTIGSGGIRTINEDSVINFYDGIQINTLSRYKDYFFVSEQTSTIIYMKLYENRIEEANEWIKEDCQIITYHNGSEVEIINAS